MQPIPTNLKVLITVMTYPHPSRSHQELVCTAGITEQGDWIRLYPVDYRYRPPQQQFHKYQWISLNATPGGARNDHRKESRKPVLDSIQILGKPIPTDNNWSERRSFVDRVPVRTVKQCRELYDQDKTSLGLVKPTRIIDMVIEDDDREWKPEWEAVLRQMRLFGEPAKPLRKIPYKFSYVFECDDSEKPHKTMCEDWELGVLFLKEVARLGSETKAAESVRNKYFNDLCAPNKDTSFFMGTIFPHNAWVVLGVFYPPCIEIKPPKPRQQSLF